MHDEFLQDLALVMLVAGVVTILFHRIRQPVVLGYILAGLIVGPHTPGIPLAVHDPRTIQTMSELGVILLMFSLGLHFSLRKLAKVGATAFIAAALEIILMIAVGYGVGRAFGWNRMDSLFLGAILAISSTTIIVKALADLGMSRERFAQLIFGILIVEDILGIAMIALLSGIARTGTFEIGSAGSTLLRLSAFLVSVLVVGLLIVPPLLRYVARAKSDEMMLITSLALCFGVSLLALSQEYSVALGAFLIGAIVAEAREHGQVELLVAPVRDMFSAIFFVAIGMLIDPNILLEHVWAIAVITAVVVVGKVFSCALGTFLAGNDARTSMRVGMGMAQIGEFSFIIAAMGLTLKVTSDFLYPIAVMVSVLTTLLTPYLIQASDRAVDLTRRLVPKRLGEYLQLYGGWISRLQSDGRGESHRVRGLIKKWTLQILLNLMLMTAIFIAAGALARRFAGGAQWGERIPDWMGGRNGIYWLGAMIASLPLLIVTVRKVRAIALVLAEQSITPSSSSPEARQQAEAIRNILVLSIRIICGAGLGLCVLALSSTIVPVWPIPIVLLVVLVILAALGWRRFERIYSAAQISLHETLTRPPESKLQQEFAQAMPGMLKDVQLDTVQVESQARSVGKLIRELELRTRTGASAVGIQREGTSIINPGPDEELQSGDSVLLLGNARQLERARKLLSET